MHRTLVEPQTNIVEILALGRNERILNALVAQLLRLCGKHIILFPIWAQQMMPATNTHAVHKP